MTNREDSDRILMADAVIEDLKQFNRLIAVDPPLTIQDIAFRMAWEVKDVRWLLKKIRDGREKVEIIARNKRILELRGEGLTFGQIAGRLSTTKGVVAGIIARHKERTSLDRG
jgi:hypothetical protein